VRGRDLFDDKLILSFAVAQMNKERVMLLQNSSSGGYAPENGVQNSRETNANETLFTFMTKQNAPN
jgi:hypothetical protein